MKKTTLTTATYIVLAEVTTAYIETQPLSWCWILGLGCP